MSRYRSPHVRTPGAVSALLEPLRVCLAAPAAVAILDAVAPRVPLGPLLGEVVERYRVLSRGFWEDQLPELLGLWIGQPHRYASYIALALLPIAVNLLVNLAGRRGYLANSVSWPIAASLCIVFVSFCFGVMTDLWIGAVGTILYVFAIVLFVALVVLLAAAAAGVTLPFTRWRGLAISSEWEINLVIVALVVFMAAVLVGILQFGGDRSSALDMKRMALFGVTLLGIYLSFKLRLKAPVYVVVAAFALVSAGWTVDFVIPAIEQLAAEPWLP